MFCTNCGDEMRDNDKFCAACGTPAAPRKKRTAPETQASASTPAAVEPASAPQSTAERFGTSVQDAGPAVSLPVSGELRPSNRAAEPAPPVPRQAEPWPAENSEEEKRRALIEAEEIASVHGMMPIEALPDPFPPAAPESRRITATTTCPTCGKLNPESSAFCESCGRKLGSTPAVEATPSPGWLYDAEQATPTAPQPAIPIPTPITEVGSAAAAATARAASADTGEGFSYYYDDNAGKAGTPKLLFVLVGVLVLGVIGIFYLMLRPSPKSAVAGNVSVSISPTHASVVPGNAFDFAATVRGSGDTDVNWSVQEGNSGGKVVTRGAQAQGGEVSNMAVYVAPSTPGTYHVIAASKADPQKTAIAEVIVAAK